MKNVIPKFSKIPEITKMNSKICLLVSELLEVAKNHSDKLASKVL